MDLTPGSQVSTTRKKTHGSTCFGQYLPLPVDRHAPQGLIILFPPEPKIPSNRGLSDLIRHTLEPIRTSKHGHFAKDGLINTKV